MTTTETCHQTNRTFRRKKGNEYVDFGDHVTDNTHAQGRGIIPLSDTSAIIGTRVSRWSDVLRVLTPCNKP